MSPSAKPNMRIVKSRAFTLVELLVVIAIIAVLVSILLPALNRARQAVQTATCMSNLRQTGIAMQMYLNDNRNTYPYGYDQYGVSQAWNPIPGGVTLVMTWNSVVPRYLKTSQILHCPAAGIDTGPYHYASLWGMMPDTRGFPTPPAISGNYYDWYDVSIVGLNPPVRSSKIGRPTDIVLLGDACLRSGTPLNQPGPVFRINTNVWTGSTQAAFTPNKKYNGANTDNDHPVPIGPNVDRLDSTGTTDNIRWRHGRATAGSSAGNVKASSANFLFCDGHVENLSPDFLLMRNVRVGK